LIKLGLRHPRKKEKKQSDSAPGKRKETTKRYGSSMRKAREGASHLRAPKLVWKLWIAKVPGFLNNMAILMVRFSGTKKLERRNKRRCQPAPMNHVKIFKGWPPRDAPSELVQLWYKTFPPDHDGRVEMKNPTRLSNKTSTA